MSRLVRTIRGGGGLVAGFAPFLQGQAPPLRFGEALFRLPIVAGILYYVAVCRDEEHCEAHVYARLTACLRESLRGDVCTRDTRIPPIRLGPDAHGLGLPLRRAMKPAL